MKNTIDPILFAEVIHVRQHHTPNSKGVRIWIMEVKFWGGDNGLIANQNTIATLDKWVLINPKRVEQYRGMKGALSVGIF